MENDTDWAVQNLDGLMNEFAVINRPLDAGEFASLYEAGKP